MHSALVPKENTIPTGIPGHYFTLNAKATFQRTPFVATFEGTNDEVILAYKVVSNLVCHRRAGRQADRLQAATGAR
jgi:hypothetical protein